jgi:putative toxin-antitoxin system antitoxin component (TIGR02293 family)
VAPRLSYDTKQGIDAFVDQVAAASPVQLADAERNGISGVFLKDLAECTRLPFVRVVEILGVSRATASEKVRKGEVLTGVGSHAAIGVAKLMAKAKAIVANSTASEAKNFDVARWLGEWIEIEQPSLGGRKPADLLDTPSGLEAVLRLLGAIESGAYQ